MASEDWQKASSRKVHLMLKDDQEQITRSRGGVSGSGEKVSKAREVACAKAWGYK